MRRWVPPPLDLVIAAVLTVAVQLETWLLVPDDLLPALAASYVLGTVAFAWHRVAPIAALAVGLTGLVVIPGAMGVDPAAYFGWFVTAFALMASVGYHARRPLVALAVALGLLALGIVLQKGFLVADILYTWLLAGGAWLAGRAVASRTLRAQLSEERAVAAEQDAQWRAAAAVTEERLRIARELHDVVSHSVTVMNLHVSGVRRRLRPDQAEERAALEAVESTGREALGEMHRMLGVLRGPGGAASGSVSGLDRLPDRLEQARSAGLEVSFSVAGDERPLPPGVEQAVYRIAQEAVTNVIRHAAASRLECVLAYIPDAVELTVVDDGRGAGPSPGSGGHGLVGMRERAALYGGSLDAGPRPGGGFAVRAVLPTPEAAQVPAASEAP
jgi:signal transduction histidine kinase